jgi:hypothetical protein
VAFAGQEHLLKSFLSPVELVFDAVGAFVDVITPQVPRKRVIQTIPSQLADWAFPALTPS